MSLPRMSNFEEGIDFGWPASASSSIYAASSSKIRCTLAIWRAGARKRTILTSKGGTNFVDSKLAISASLTMLAHGQIGLIDLFRKYHGNLYTKCDFLMDERPK